MLTTKDPIGDILARVKYLSNNGGIRERHLRQIIIQNGYATDKTWGSYHKPIVREGRTFDLYIDVVVNTVNDEYYYSVKEGHVIMVFINSYDTIKKYSWSEIKKEYNILERYDLSLPELDSLGWTITYP